MYYALHDHWAEFGPPVYMMVASYLGVTGKAKATEKPKAGTMADLFKTLGGGKAF